MKYPKEYLDEIKTRLKVSTVVSKSVALKKRGKEYYTQDMKLTNKILELYTYFYSRR